MIKYLSILLLFGWIGTVFGQDKMPTGQGAKSNNKEILDELAKIKLQLGDIMKLQQVEATQNVALLKSKDWTNIPYFYKRGNENPVGHVKIDSINILTKDGYIVGMQAITNGQTFSNATAPIGLTIKRMNQGDRLVYRNRNIDEYIYVSDLVQFINHSPYIPDDEQFVLKEDHTHYFKKGVGINSIFDLRLYSDALAIFGAKPNGLFQTEANFRQIIHRGNFRNLGLFLPANYVKFNLKASKFDSQLGVTDSAAMNRSMLLQRSWLNTDVKFSLINGWMENKSLSTFYVNLGAGLNISNLTKSTDTTSIISYNFICETGTDLKITDNIGTNISATLFWNHSPQIDFGDQQSKRCFFNPQVDFYWNPKGNLANRIFGRISYTADINDKKHHFLQAQFGYSVLLSKLINKE